ncbi:MAG: hypothetical protein GOMPHAMPRED_007323 [Gomphillus americanus]|uniref:Calcineurin-like phosphoesterase domain-containing protein n=1 Tax=Gomphillus americanus TaxID=1940652 RepID=A0A8H3EVN6_9LECA|nr:MAG: hypothetical protein GOMPHAMPRED_007323 [Gomphillus americanus]
MPSPHTLYAISDIHLSYPQNREYWSALPLRKHDFPPKSGLILAGDVGESISHLRLALEIALQVFSYVWWIPGNHELYTLPGQHSPTENNASTGDQAARDAEIDSLRGEERYQAFIRVCHQYPGVYTPEDEWVIWDCSAEEDPITTITTKSQISSSPSNQQPQQPSSSAAALICPLFTLYDYTFRPAHLHSTTAALAWAAEKDIIATDEALLHSDPHPNKASWSSQLVSNFHTRLTSARARFPSLPFVLINHWPLREEVLHIPSIPRFSLWCGTRSTRHWDTEFAPVAVVVSGHLHVRRTDWIGDTRWEEVSLGYPRQWTKIREQELDVAELLREVLPGRAAEDARREGRAEVAGAEDQKGRVEGQVTLYRTYGGR